MEQALSGKNPCCLSCAGDHLDVDQFQAVADAAEEAESQNAAWVRGDGGDINPGVEVPQINPLSAAVDTASTVEEALEEIALEDLDFEDLECESPTACDASNREEGAKDPVVAVGRAGWARARFNARGNPASSAAGVVDVDL